MSNLTLYQNLRKNALELLAKLDTLIANELSPLKDPYIKPSDSRRILFFYKGNPNSFVGYYRLSEDVYVVDGTYTTYWADELDA